MANSSVTYVGNGGTTNFSVTFPYISRTHIEVKVNGITQLSPADYSWLNDSTIQFATAPAADAAVVIRRRTPHDERLVDFQNGAVLTENELDLAFEQNFYLAQEIRENWQELVDDALLSLAGGLGIVDATADDVVDNILSEILSDDLASELQARINDIDANAESILEIASTINEITAGTVFVQADEPVPGVGGVPDPIPDNARWYDSDDGNRPYIYQTGAWVDVSDSRITANEADISALDVRLTDAESGITTNASAISVLDTTVTSHGNSITSISSDVTALENTVNNPTTGVAANASGLSALDTRVTATEGTISSQGSAITALESTVNNPTTGVAANATAVSALDTRVTDNEGDITAQASSISTLQTTVGDNSSSITTLQSSVNGLEARYGVTLNANGYVTGFEQFNDGDVGTFQILADKFYVVDPASGGQNPVIPFAIVGGTVHMQNVVIGTAVIDDAAITSLKIAGSAITSDKIDTGAVTAAALESDLILAGKIRTKSTGNRVELEDDADTPFPFWIGSGTKGSTSGSPGSGAKMWYDADADEVGMTATLDLSVVRGERDEALSATLPSSDYASSRAPLCIWNRSQVDDWTNPGTALSTSYTYTPLMQFNSPENAQSGSSRWNLSHRQQPIMLMCHFDGNMAEAGELEFVVEYRYDEGTWQEATTWNTYSPSGSYGGQIGHTFMYEVKPKSTAYDTVDIRYGVREGSASLGANYKLIQLITFSANIGPSDSPANTLT